MNQNLYERAALELMTTYQLREICRQHKLMNGLVNPMDKEGLIRVVMRNLGRREELLITETDPEGEERLISLFSHCKLIEKDSDGLTCHSVLAAYSGLSIELSDAYTIPYREQLAGTNAFVLSKDGTLCTILNIREKRTDPAHLYLTKSGAVEAREADQKEYTLYCVSKRTSDELYQVYHGKADILPEHLEVWKIPLIDFQVRQPIQLSLPMAIDFGSVNTAAGVYLDTAYLEQMGRMAGILGLKEHAVNYTLFDYEGEESVLLPSVVGVRTVEEADYQLAFGREAERLAEASYIDEGFCIFYDIKRWVCDYEKEEELTDRQGHRRWVKREDLLRRFFLYIIEKTENRFKCHVTQVHISSPVKQKYRFRQMFERVLPEYQISGEGMLDEGMAVLYNTISNLITGKNVIDNKMYEALVVDCGGGTTDLCSYGFRIHDGRTSYRIELQSTYENGDTDFGGNNLTYRVMQLLKLELLHRCGYQEMLSASELLEQMDTDVDRFIDEKGAKEYYRVLDEAYARAEKFLPTRYAEYERYNRSDYYKVKNNFYTLFHLAEQLKKQIYGHAGRLEVTVCTRQKMSGRDICDAGNSTVFLDKWKLSFREKGGLSTRRELPEVTFNIFQMDLLLEGEVYGITHKFMEEMYENGRLNQFSFIKLTGQSCKMELFRNALKEFVPGRMIQFRKRASKESAEYELKMTCVDGALKYLRDKHYGTVDLQVGVKNAVIPYQVTAFTHDGREVILLDGAGDWEQAGCISRTLDELTLQMYLKDGNGEERYRFRYQCHPEEFELRTNEEIKKVYGHYIPQKETDSILNREVKFFVWARQEDWGYQVVPVCRKEDELYLGRQEFYCFENDSWVNSFYDGLK